MRIGAIQKKILLLLLGGLTMGLSGNPRQCFRVVKIVGREWKKISREEKKNKANFQRSLRKLYDSKLISTKENSDGTVKLVLTEKGRETAIGYDTKKLKRKKLKKWDGKWRIVIFDIPEDRRAKRDAFRTRLKRLGFLELQKSVWISPIDYEREINYLIEVFDISSYVNFITADFVKSKKRLEKHFKIKT